MWTGKSATEIFLAKKTTENVFEIGKNYEYLKSSLSKAKLVKGKSFSIKCYIYKDMFCTLELSNTNKHFFFRQPTKTSYIESKKVLYNTFKINTFEEAQFPILTEYNDIQTLEVETYFDKMKDMNIYLVINNPSKITYLYLEDTDKYINNLEEYITLLLN